MRIRILLVALLFCLSSCDKSPSQTKASNATVAPSSSATAPIPESAPTAFRLSQQTTHPLILIDQNGQATRIVGGVPPKIGTFRYVIGLLQLGVLEPACTGVMISQDIALTAAHCACGQADDKAYIGDDPGDNPPTATEERTIDNWYSLPTCPYDRKPGNPPSDSAYPGQDIAVYKLKPDGPAVTPVRIASDDDINGAVVFRIMGYGATDANATEYDFRKLYAMVPNVDAVCRGRTNGEANAVYYGCVPGKEIVAGRKGTPALA